MEMITSLLGLASVKKVEARFETNMIAIAVFGNKEEIAKDRGIFHIFNLWKERDEVDQWKTEIGYKDDNYGNKVAYMISQKP